MLQVPEPEEQERLIAGYRARGISERRIHRLLMHWKLCLYPELDSFDEGWQREPLTEEQEVREEWEACYQAAMRVALL